MRRTCSPTALFTAFVSTIFHAAASAAVKVAGTANDVATYYFRYNTTQETQQTATSVVISEASVNSQTGVGACSYGPLGSNFYFIDGQITAERIAVSTNIFANAGFCMRVLSHSGVTIAQGITQLNHPYNPDSGFPYTVPQTGRPLGPTGQYNVMLYTVERAKSFFNSSITNASNKLCDAFGCLYSLLKSGVATQQSTFALSIAHAAFNHKNMAEVVQSWFKTCGASQVALPNPLQYANATSINAFGNVLWVNGSQHAAQAFAQCIASLMNKQASSEDSLSLGSIFGIAAGVTLFVFCCGVCVSKNARNELFAKMSDCFKKLSCCCRDRGTDEESKELLIEEETDKTDMDETETKEKKTDDDNPLNKASAPPLLNQSLETN